MIFFGTFQEKNRKQALHEPETGGFTNLKSYENWYNAGREDSTRQKSTINTCAMHRGTEKIPGSNDNGATKHGKVLS